MRFPHDVPTLRDGDVAIRAHRPEDATGAYEQCRDPLSRRWTTVPLDYQLADAERFVRHVMPDGWTSGQELGFAVEAVDDDGTPRYAGTISLRDEGDERAELAYGAHPWVRGRGVMERALRLLLDHGFTEHGFRTVIWWAHRGNWASRKVAWRLGFTVDGSARQWLAQRGELRDAWVGTLLSTDTREPRTPWLEPVRLDGDQVVLRRMRPEDTHRVVEGCLDPQTRRWLGQIPQPFTLRHARDFLEDVEERHANGSAVTWAIADPVTDDLIGLVNLFGLGAVSAEVGYWVHPQARKRGVATEATRLALRHAFVPLEEGGLGLGRVHALAAADNTASQAVLRRAGLREAGRSRRTALVEGGRYVDAVTFDVLAEELRGSG